MMSILEWVESIPEDLKICILDLILTGFFGFSMYGISKTFNEKEAVLKTLKDAPWLTPGKQLEEALTSNKTIPYAVVKGKVAKDKHVIKAFTEGVQAVYRICENQDVYSKLGWKGQRFQLHGEVYIAEEFHPFRLIDNSKSEPSLYINNIAAPNTQNLLTSYPTTIHRNSNQFTWMKATSDYLFGFATLIGREGTEKVLAVDQEITAIGRIVITNKGQYLLTAPTGPNTMYTLTTQSVEEIVKQYTVQTTALSFAICVLTVGGICLVFDAIRRIMKYLKSKPPEGLPEDDLIEIMDDPADRDGRDLPDFLLCIVCQEHDRNVIFRPCSHICVCRQCANQIGNVCPVCRRNIQSVDRVYLT